MKELEQLQHSNALISYGEPSLSGVGVWPLMSMARTEIVAGALYKLWRDLDCEGEPLIFRSPSHGQMYTEHHPALLEQLLTRGANWKRTRFGQLASWRRLPAPTSALGVAATQERGTLLKADMLHEAEPGDRGTIPGVPYGWLYYQFVSGWVAISVHYYDPDDNEHEGILVALPPGRQDEWLAFLKLLDDIHAGIMHRRRRGRIEIIGGDDDLVTVIERTSFDDVVLPEDTLAQVAAQRRIFDQKILRRYASLRVPRLRKVLLIGPPGTGKTTLLKAEGARHAKQGGLVIYVSAPPRGRGASSWQQLAYALRSAAESSLPALVLVEDFEMFVADRQELQLVLNTLDGVATPDNPRGTLLLATSNDPEKIDQRIRDRPGRVDVLIEIGPVNDTALAIRFLQHFLGSGYREEEHAALASQLVGQPGSHFREVCIAGAMRALDQERTEVRREDLLWAHETILSGRALAAQAERFVPSSPRKRGGYFGKNQ